MSTNTYRVRHLTSINNENPIKNIKNNLISDRKKSALKVLTNTVQSTKNIDGKNLKQFKVLPMKNFDTEIKCKSPNITNNHNEEFNHIGCVIGEKDILPPSMTCNISMLSNFFSRNDDDRSDWFLEDYNNVMINKIKNTFEHFGEPNVENTFPPMPIMEFPELVF